MVKIDLITGFLGSGKTTFIRKYVKYLINNNEKVCILENDYGAINVDMMLLSDLKSDKLGIEMVAGGCDIDCHRRRFKTKLITMAMLGYTRVIVEPSGIFDVDEFFDILHEDPLYDRYQIDNVIAIVNANLENDVSKEADYMLASQVACAGSIILSCVQDSDEKRIDSTIHHINKALEDIHCIKRFNKDENIIIKDWNHLNDEDYYKINHSHYRETGFVKNFSMDSNNFQNLFFMNLKINKNEVIHNIHKVWEDKEVGNIIRIKGFIQDENSWIEINSTKENMKIESIKEGQNIIIIIGENLNAEKIENYFPCEHSTLNLD